MNVNFQGIEWVDWFRSTGHKSVGMPAGKWDAMLKAWERGVNPSFFRPESFSATGLSDCYYTRH